MRPLQNSTNIYWTNWCPTNLPGIQQAPLAHYIVKLAQLGGYLARAHDPPPGNTVIWRGLSRLTDIELGIMIGAQLVGN